MEDFLEKCDKAYYSGNPIISDSQYDLLREASEKESVGHSTSDSAIPHLFPMYSLKNYYVGEDETPSGYSTILSHKLDGAAISLLYINGKLTRGLTRGSGIKGENITDKVLLMDSIPNTIDITSKVMQITGEVVSPKEIPNSRNYASGSLNLKSLSEFKNRKINFVAYGVESENFELFDTYISNLKFLGQTGFTTILDFDISSELDYPTDGIVERIDSNKIFQDLGYTSKYPRGAWAIKTRTEGIKTTLEDVVWQVGKSGKVTPVALLAPVDIDGAVVSRATLNNIGFIRELDLEIGCEVMVERSGGIIPRIISKVD